MKEGETRARLNGKLQVDVNGLLGEAVTR